MPCPQPWPVMETIPPSCAGDREEIRIQAEVHVELGPRDRDVLGSPVERDRVHPPKGKVEGMSRIRGCRNSPSERTRAVARWYRSSNRESGRIDRPVVVGVSGYGVAVIRHRSERRLLVGARGVATCRSGVLGGGNLAARHHHDLAGGVVGGRDTRRRFVFDTPVGLAEEVTGVGIAAVTPEVRQHVGADGDRLGLELLEAPRHLLRTGSTQGAPGGG